MRNAPSSLDELFASIDRCGRAYGGANWEAQAVLGLALMLLIVAVLFVLYMMLRMVK